jgi:hypothetical protein
MPPQHETVVATRDDLVQQEASSGLADCFLNVLRGPRVIERFTTQLVQLLERTGQESNPLLWPNFFLGRVALLSQNRPVVLLVYSAGLLQGAVYLVEKTLCGLPTGYLRCFDHLTGESSVIAPLPIRSSLLSIAIQQLFLTTPARVAWATVCEAPGSSRGDLLQHASQATIEARSMDREHRIILSGTLAETLGRFGSHTRRNLRYYRRRAETELKVSFEPQLTSEESDRALDQLETRCFQPQQVSMAEWRKMDKLLRTQTGYFAIGLRMEGAWISYLAGIRAGDKTYVLLQINHNQFPRYSLSTVLRSYFFEREIELGQKEIKFVNGTCAFFQRCCEQDTCLTISARRGLIAFMLFHWIAPWHSAPDHALNMRRWSAIPEHTA